MPPVSQPASPLLRLRLTDGRHVVFDNYLDLLEFVFERMVQRGDL
jgi:hypothetical protein